MIRSFAVLLFISIVSFTAQAESEALLKDKTQYLHHLRIGRCRFEVVPQASSPAAVKVKVWIDGKPSRIFYSGEGSGDFYSEVEAQFSFDQARWRSHRGTSGLSKLTLYSTYTNGTSSSGLNRKWLEAWYGPKGDIVHVRLTSKRNGPTLLGIITPTSYSVDCER